MPNQVIRTEQRYLISSAVSKIGWFFLCLSVALGSMHACMHLHDTEFIPPSVSFAPSSSSSLSSSSLLFNQTTVMNELPTTLGYVFMLLLAWLLCSTSWIVPYESTAVCRQWDEALSMQKKNFGLSGLSKHLISFFAYFYASCLSRER